MGTTSSSDSTSIPNEQKRNVSSSSSSTNTSFSIEPIPSAIEQVKKLNVAIFSSDIYHASHIKHKWINHNIPTTLDTTAIPMTGTAKITKTNQNIEVKISNAAIRNILSMNPTPSIAAKNPHIVVILGGANETDEWFEGCLKHFRSILPSEVLLAATWLPYRFARKKEVNLMNFKSVAEKYGASFVEIADYEKDPLDRKCLNQLLGLWLARFYKDNKKLADVANPVLLQYLPKDIVGVVNDYFDSDDVVDVSFSSEYDRW
jgi:hypothetical protein